MAGEEFVQTSDNGNLAAASLGSTNYLFYWTSASGNYLSVATSANGASPYSAVSVQPLIQTGSTSNHSIASVADSSNVHLFFVNSSGKLDDRTSTATGTWPSGVLASYGFTPSNKSGIAAIIDSTKRIQVYFTDSTTSQVVQTTLQSDGTWSTPAPLS